MGSSKIRILHLVQRYFPRGAEVFAAQLAGALAARGHENVLCGMYRAASDGFPFPGRVESLSLAMAEHSLPARLGFQPSLLLKVVNAFKKVRPDVVIAHGGDTLRYTAMARLFYPRPRAIYRNIDVASFWARGRSRVWLGRRFLGWMDAVASVSQVSRDDFIRCYGMPAGKVVAIANGVDLTPQRRPDIEAIRRRVRDELGIPGETTVLVNVGSLCYQKNQEELLSLLSEIDDTSVHLLLVGDGPKRGEFEEIAAGLGLRERARFLGVQPDVTPFLAAADIFVLPSRTEGMPAVLIEAGAAGLPAVAYDVGGVKEVIVPGVTGSLVPAGDREGLMAAVVSMMKDPGTRRRMGAAAREKYPALFDITVIAGQYEELMGRILRERGRD